MEVYRGSIAGKISVNGGFAGSCRSPCLAADSSLVITDFFSGILSGRDGDEKDLVNLALFFLMVNSHMFAWFKMCVVECEITLLRVIPTMTFQNNLLTALLYEPCQCYFIRSLQLQLSIFPPDLFNQNRLGPTGKALCQDACNAS